MHPEERCNILTEDQLEALHTQTAEVCRFAVSVNADDSKFPEDWLFQHRWVYAFAFCTMYKMGTDMIRLGEGKEGKAHPEIGQSPLKYFVKVVDSPGRWRIVAQWKAGNDQMDNGWWANVRICRRAPEAQAWGCSRKCMWYFFRVCHSRPISIHSQHVLRTGRSQGG